MSSKKSKPQSQEVEMFLEAIDAIAQSSTPWKLDDLLPLARSDAFDPKETELCIRAITARKYEMQRDLVRAELTRVLAGETDKLQGARARVDTLGGCDVEKAAKGGQISNPYANSIYPTRDAMIDKLLEQKRKEWYASMQNSAHQGTIGGIPYESYENMSRMQAAQAQAAIQNKIGGI